MDKSTVASGLLPLNLYNNFHNTMKKLSFLILITTAYGIPSFASNLTSCGVLSSADTTYVLQNNVTANGTCFTVTANNITIDLNGKTVIYDNSPPITVNNGSFESTLSGTWDTTGGANASRVAGTYLTPSLYEGSYALNVTTPTANQQIRSIGTVTLQPNTKYSLSGMVYNQTDDAITLGIRFDGTSISASQVGKTYRGFQYIYTQFSTGSSEVSYKINLSVTGASSSPAGVVFFDDIRVQQSDHHGVHSGISWARNASVKNGTITQGQAHGDFSHAIYGVGNPVIAGDLSELTINVSGNSTKAIDITYIDNISIYNNKINSAVDTIHIRDHYDGALIKIGYPGNNGSIHHNVITSGVQTGIIANSSKEEGRIQIYNNDITLQSKYTNDFAIVSYGAYGPDIHNNIVRCGSENNTCRGIYMNSNGGSIYKNTINVHYKNNNQEYPGCPYNAYGIQLEELSFNTEVYDNIVTANADECGAAAFRFSGNSEVGARGNYVHDNTFKAVAVNGSTKIACTVQIAQSYADQLIFSENTLETNSCWLNVDTLADGMTDGNLDRSLTLDGNRFVLIQPKAALYHPLVDGTYGDGTGSASPRNVSLINNSYSDSTVKADMSTAQFVSRYMSYKVDPYAYNIIIEEENLPTPNIIKITTPTP